MNWLKQLVSDGQQPSTYRLLMFVVIVPMVIVWMVISIRTNTFATPDPRVLAFIASLFGGKVLQAFAESKTPNQS
jgi:uncharacterized membrane-anchored protein